MPQTPPASSEVRAWAQAKGLDVGDRGRLRADVVAAYLADQQGARKSRPSAPEPLDGVAALQERVAGLEEQVNALSGTLQAVQERLEAMTQVQIRRRPSLRRRLSG